MKKLLLLLFVLLPFETSAQNFVGDGSKYDAYCDVECKWKINEERHLIGELTDKYKHRDLGIVLSYDNVVSKIATGKFLLKHVG